MIKVNTLEVKFSFNGKEDLIYPVILSTSTESILVDCGYAGFMPLLEAAAGVHGLSLQDLTGIIITHHDIDHVGGLHEIKAQYPSLKVYSLDVEEKYISGKEKSIRLQQAEDMFTTLPDEHKPGALYFQEMLKAIQPVEVDGTFSADEHPDFLEGLQIIHTPGHMPGHISLYLREHKILVSSDAIVIEHGEFEIANPHFTLNLDQAVESVRKLAKLEIDEVICYHGGIMKGNISQKLNKLISRYS